MYTLGRIWKHVWGSLSDEYAKEVIRSYLCYHGTIVKRRSSGQLPNRTIASIHRAGSTRRELRIHREFGRMVEEMADASEPLILLYIMEMIPGIIM